MTNDKKLQTIVHNIIKSVNPVKIYLFGSRARDNYRQDSDYDLVIIYDGEISSQDIKLKIREHCWEIDAAMDLIVINSEELENYKPVALTISREITENGIILYEQGKEPLHTTMA